MEISEEKLIEIAGLDTDGVSVAFELILEQLSIVEQELKSEGTKAFEKADFFKASELGESGKALSGFKSQLQALANQWDSDIESGTKQRVPKSLKPHRKSPKTKLRVTFPNGFIVSDDSAAETFVNVIRELGVDNVYKLDLRINRIPLVSKNKSTTNNQKRLGGYYVCTHSNTKTKKKQLENIADLLGKSLIVEIT